MLRRFFRFITRGWVLALLVVLAVALLIWFVGPLVAIAGVVPLASPMARLVAILVLLLIWGLNNLRLRAARDKAERELTEAVNEDAASAGDSAGNGEAHAEEAMLARRLREALATLRQARLTRGRRLYDLPWYVIIGASGSGKTTALRQSGLRFPLHDEIGENPVQGAGGTRYCDWWFTDEAVLIDTAGRYTTQDDPRRIESRAWLGFLSLLRKARPKRPLNGVIVTVSVLDLLKRTDTQLAIQSAAIKHRIQELNGHLGMELPVYVVFTKCDLLAGFNEFFADLDAEEREQVWGITFAHTRASGTGDSLQRLPDEFEALAARLEDRVLQRLDAEREPRRRALIHEFPRQVLALRERLQTVLREVFVPNQFEQPALLRGVYLVSGTQTATAGQRVTGVLPADVCELPVSADAAGAPRSFFVTRLLREVIFGEAQVAASSVRARRRFRWTCAAIAAAASIAFIASAGAWYTSHRANERYLARVDDHIETYEAETGGGLGDDSRDWLMLATGLDQLRSLPTGYGDDPAEAPMALGFGLYQGEKVGAQARRTYLEALERFFMPVLADSLAARIRPGEGNNDVLYEALRFYLMLYNPEHMDREAFRVWSGLMWQSALPGPRAEPVRQALRSHLEVALNEGVQPPPMDAERVKRAREVLVQTPLERRLYRRLKSEYLQTHDGQFTVEGVLGRKAEVILYRRSGKPLDEGISRFFTYKHFHTGFNVKNGKLAERLADERWIYGDMVPEAFSDEQLSELKAQVRELYFNEYISRWRALLEDLAVRSFSSASRGHVVVNMLASSRQPLVELLTAIRKHTALSEPPASSKAAGEAADAVSDDVMRSEKRRLERLVPDSAGDDSVTLPGGRVTDAFITFNDYVSGEEGLPLQRLQSALETLKGYLDRLAYSRDVGRTAFKASRAGEDPVIAVRQALAAAPPVLREWFGALPGNMQRVSAAATEDHINDAWRARVVGFYREAIAGRYPVAPDARQEVRLEDFTRFFGPGGLLQGYFREYVKPFVDTSGERWRWHTDVDIADEALAVFQRAARIRRAYFHDGERPSVSMLIRPYSLDASITSALLESVGTTVRYQHGPVRSAVLSWPAKSNDRSRLVLNPGSSSTPLSTRVEGEWSLFRLLEQADMQPLDGGEGYRAAFRLEGASAVYEIRPRSIHHPFERDLLDGFTLPEAL